MGTRQIFIILETTTADRLAPARGDLPVSVHSLACGKGQCRGQFKCPETHSHAVTRSVN